MKRVLIDKLKGGEILAQEVWDKKGVRLLVAGATYKVTYRKMLENLSIDYLHIEEHRDPANEIQENYIDPEVFYRQTKELVAEQLKRFEDIGSVNVYRFEKFIYSVMDEVLQSTNVIESLYIMQSYNSYTYEHSIRVTIVAIMICAKMELSRYKTYEIAIGCILHDLGKTNVIEEILNKPGKLTDEEFNQIKKHPADGYKYVRNNMNLTDAIKRIILTHHEKLDGTGYPLGIKGRDISLGARICTVADIFDAMCSKRPYKDAMPLAESMRIMKTTMNKQLDMEVCSNLEQLLAANT